MSNLTTFFPSGGGASFFGQTLTATASGAIADGDPIVLNADGTVSAVSATGVILFAAGETMFVVGSGSDSVYRYNLGTAFDVSTASYSGDSFSLAAEDGIPRSPFFSSDGTKMFVIGDTDNDVNEYALTVPYDITTASYTQNFSVAAQETNPSGLAFSPDGLKMFVTGYSGDDVNEYDLSIAWDISTAVYSQNFSVASQDAVPTGLAFNTDGTKMFVTGNANDAIFEYDLSSGFDLSTASYSGTSLSVSAQDTSPQGVCFNTNGTKMFFVGAVNRFVYAYDLSSGFDLSTASYSGTSFSVASQETVPLGLVFGGDGLTTNLTTANDYIGISNGAYADATTATIQLVGSVDDAQSGLTAGQMYYVQTDGSLSTTPDTPEVEAGYAISATGLVVKGAYSTIPVTAPVYQPTPLADSTPQQFQVSYNALNLYSNTTLVNATSTTFWAAIDRQGAYIINTNPTAYTEIVRVTGSGVLGTIVTGALANDDIFLEVTIDDEVREWRAYMGSSYRCILTFSPNLGWDNNRAMQSNDAAGFHTSLTTDYSTFYNGTNTVASYLSPTSITAGIRFKKNMSVRIKSATAFNTGSLQNQHGVLYVID